MDILTVTLNPAIDKAFTVDRLEPDHKLRSPNPRVDAGGGGINVARGILRLGGSVRALVLSGGPNGERLLSLLASEGIPVQPFPIDGETRESVMVTESSTGRQYRIVAKGPAVGEADALRLLDAIDRLDPFPDCVVASGSLPQGLPEDYYASIARIVARHGARFIVDAGGPALRWALDAGVYLAKPNLRELEDLTGSGPLETDQVDEAAQALIRNGNCTVVAVSLGAAGAMWVTRDAHGRVPAPTVQRKSTVGAGDSMVAGMVWSMANGRNLDEMVRMGVACGTAATMNPGTELFRPEQASALYDWILRQKK